MKRCILKDVRKSQELELAFKVHYLINFIQLAWREAHCSLFKLPNAKAASAQV